jgi:hypothetical protein
VSSMLFWFGDGWGSIGSDPVVVEAESNSRSNFWFDLSIFFEKGGALSCLRHERPQKAASDRKPCLLRRYGVGR